MKMADQDGGVVAPMKMADQDGGVVAPQKPTISSFNVVDCKVESVVVYLDRAEVSRSVKVAVTAGANEVIFKEMSPFMDVDSIRVEGEGSASILEVSFETRHLPTERVGDTSTSSELRRLLTQTEEKLARLGIKETRLKKQREMLDSVVTSVTPGKEAPTDDAVNAIVSLLDMYNTQTERLDDQLTDLGAEMKVVRDEIGSLQRNLSELNHPPSYVLRQLSVLLDAQSESEVQLKVSYVVTHASWLPKYDIRVFSNDSQMKIQYYGVIQQSTGEDWTDVKIALSTAMPSIGGNVPQLDTRILRFKRKIVLAKRAKNARSVRMFAAPARAMPMMMDAAPAGFGGMALSANAEPEMAEELDVVTTEVREGIVSTMYEIARSSTIPSDNIDHKVSVAIIDLKPEFEHESVPKISSHAYVKAKVRNTSNYALLAGPSNIFLDNNFIAKASLKAVSPSEEFDCSLGIDPAVKITYKPVHKFREQAGLFTKSAILTYQQEIEVNNGRQDSIKILVTDQLPLSSEEKIKVNLLEPNLKTTPKAGEPSPVRLNGQNNVEWHVPIAAGEKKTLVLKYSVEHPINEEIV